MIYISCCFNRLQGIDGFCGIDIHWRCQEAGTFAGALLVAAE
jgi:hypothetical protein